MNNSFARRDGYRPEIDGLRAIAVLSVLFYHLRNTLIPGGYVGVDIFFVISGFLITRNIWGELQEGRFSLGNFYLRRIRRIAPASLLVTAVTLAAGMLLLLPADLGRLSRSAVWVSLSAGNIYFWKHLDTSYFAAASDQEPLLHFWSLGVEEQYYLLWPALLIGCAAAKRARPVAIAAIVLICIASFALAEMTNVEMQKFSYYMLPTRAGELMLGAILALYGSDARLDALQGGLRRLVSETSSMLGIGLIGLSLWWLNDDSAFPGLNAIYPCLGSVLLIFSGLLGSRTTSLLLTPRPMVFVGLISYSLYLWHWPILAYLKYFYGDISPIKAVVALMVMFALATLSYRWVERPARRMRGGVMWQVAVLLVVPLVLVLGAALALLHFIPGRPPAKGASDVAALAAERLAKQTAPAGPAAFPCMDAKAPLVTALDDPQCVLGAHPHRGSPSVLLWGDSNAAHFIGTLDAVGLRNGFAFRYSSLSTCPPVFGDGEFGARQARDRCQKFREGMRGFIAKKRFRTVVLAGQWVTHDTNPQFRSALERTLSELEALGLRVVMLGQVPGFPGYNKDCELRVGLERCMEQQRRLRRAPFPVSEYMAGLAADESSVFFLDIDDVLCGDRYCSPYLKGVPVYFNPTHLSARGSFQIGKALMTGASRADWEEAFAEPTKKAKSGLFTGYHPPFRFKVRSQRHVETGNKLYQHVVIAEYLEGDGESIGDALQTSLRARGFAVDGPKAERDSIRYLAKRGSLQVTIVVHPRPALKFRAPGARGIVSFAWRDRHMR